MNGCPRWSFFGSFGHCSKTCGGGTRYKTRRCICGYIQNPVTCSAVDHPLASNNLCDGKCYNQRESNGYDEDYCTDTSPLSPCATEPCSTADGEGPGCKHDSRQSLKKTSFI